MTMTLEEARIQVEEAFKVAERRKEIEFFDGEKNIKELLFDIDYRLNKPKKTFRKID